jgi:hypothetical protein
VVPRDVWSAELILTLGLADTSKLIAGNVTFLFDGVFADLFMF